MAANGALVTLSDADADGLDAAVNRLRALSPDVIAPLAAAAPAPTTRET
ncbi:MAG TPA: hypothetical protein PLC86_19480 [Candidatus Accumulibacter phosphatis]|nr:hypothetical protein [Candidatus Accumulibacter phosphatis]